MRKIALLAALAAAVFCVFPQRVCAQAAAANSAGAVAVRKLAYIKTQTPQYMLSVSTMKGRSRDWLHVLATYDTDAKWTDELTFTFYILVRSKDPQAVNRNTMFRGKVSYINIERGRGHMADVFLHPSMLARYGDVERVAVVVESGGKPVATDSQPPSSPRWWDNFSPVDGSILNRQQTPFAMMNYDDYEAMKPYGAAQ